MGAPAGPCEWCGGPQWWTVVLGAMYVCCKAGCLPLPLEGEVLPGTAGSTIEHEGVDLREARQYLTREGREAEAEAIALSGDYGSPD